MTYPSSTVAPLKSENKPFKQQLLKWIGNKQRFAEEIISYFPDSYGTYFEPFLGSGAVLGTLSPIKAEASDTFGPLIEIWQQLSDNPNEVVCWYEERWNFCSSLGWKIGYESIRNSYNSNPNGADLLYLSRSCYGGVIRFRQKDGFMSTPVGAHKPISPESFRIRADEWSKRVRGTNFQQADFQESLLSAKAGDLIYCDPPYSNSQSILYGAQNFSLNTLFNEIYRCKERGVHVALSIDGTKKSGNYICDIPIPKDLFEREVSVNVGRSMFKRFQMAGKTLHKDIVTDRLLLTY